LQKIVFHTSCSQPLALGDQFGSVVLVGFQDEQGNVAADNSGNLGDDADTAPGPSVPVGDTVTFNYVVTNTGEVPLANVVVVDDDGTGDFGTGFNPSFAGGDDNNDSLLDLNETWLYTADHVVTAGLFTNDSRATGDGAGQTVVDTDPANHTGELAPIDVCESGQKPSVLTMRYNGDGEVITNSQDGKANAYGDPDDASPVYIVASSKRDLNSSKTKIWFEGFVSLNGTFEIDSQNEGKSRLNSTTYVQIFTDASKNARLQKVLFHTSCSKPLNIGDQFGSVVLEQFVGEGGAQIPTPLHAADVLVDAQPTSANALTRASLQQAVVSGIEYWQAAGVAEAQLNVLRNADVGIAHLSGSLLGLAYPGNYILIDNDAAGFGWADTSSGGVNLNDTLAHEFGHLLGYDHDVRGGVMGSTLAPVSVASDAVDAVFATSAVNSLSVSDEISLRHNRGETRRSSGTLRQSNLHKVDLALSSFARRVSLDDRLLHSLARSRRISDDADAGEQLEEELFEEYDRLETAD
jgi:hypothetical protein